jgi:hypothetical protein
MATRPIFIPGNHGELLVRECDVAFEWAPGMSLSQARKRIAALHSAAQSRFPGMRLLEISTKSPDSVGRSLSAFNLSVKSDVGRVPLECAYQASKCFARGGPFRDLLTAEPREAKGDERLRTSGSLVAFEWAGVRWPLQPTTAFYDFLYIGAVRQRAELFDQALTFDAFTDIAFNPEKSAGCQARSIALMVSLHRLGELEAALADRDVFCARVAGQVGRSQGQLFGT